MLGRSHPLGVRHCQGPGRAARADQDGARAAEQPLQVRLEARVGRGAAAGALSAERRACRRSRGRRACAARSVCPPPTPPAPPSHARGPRPTLQGGISALLDAMRDTLATQDASLLLALLNSLADITSSAQNAQLLAKENGIAVLLGCVLSHLKNEVVMLPALQVRMPLALSLSQRRLAGLWCNHAENRTGDFDCKPGSESLAKQRRRGRGVVQAHPHR